MQRHAHLFGNGPEEIIENFQHYRIGFGADCGAGGQGLDAGQDHMVMRGEARLPAILDHDGLVLLDDDRRASDSLAALHRFTQHHACLVEFALREEARQLCGLCLLIAVERLGVFHFTGAAANGLHFNRIDDERLVFRDEAEPALMGGLEFGAQARSIVFRREGRLDGKSRVGARIADMGAKVLFHGICLDALRGKFGNAFVRQFLAQFFQCLGCSRIERDTKRLLARCANIGKPHAIGGKQTRHRMKKNVLHAQRIGHQAGMLPARAAETVERIARHVIAALDGNFLDRLHHIGDGNANKTIRDRLRRAPVADLARKCGEEFAHARHISGWFCCGPKIAGKNSGRSLPSMTLASVTASGPPLR